MILLGSGMQGITAAAYCILTSETKLAKHCLSPSAMISQNTRGASFQVG